MPAHGSSGISTCSGSSVVPGDCGGTGCSDPSGSAIGWMRWRGWSASVAVNALPRVPCHNDLHGRELHRRRSAALAHRLRVQRQRRPMLRVGDTRRSATSTSAEVRPVYRVLRSPRHGAAGADGAVRDDGRRRLDALGGDPAKISTIDFDFWGWAVERWDRATAVMDGPGFRSVPSGGPVRTSSLTHTLAGDRSDTAVKIVATPGVV